MKIHKPPAYEKLDVFARLKDKRTFKGEVRNGSDGNYICTVLPPELGKYQIHVRCNGLDIPGSPLKAKVMPAQVGRENKFIVSTKNAGIGELKIDMEKDGEIMDV